MEFYVAGYYLIQASNKKDWMDRDNLLPEKILSGSRHICPKIPDAWIFNWVSDSESVEDLKYARTQLNLSDYEFSNVQRDFDELFNSDQYGFPNVFMNAEIAHESYKKYFYSVPNLKLLGLAIPETLFDNFVNAYKSDGFMYSRKNGVYKKILQKEKCIYSPIGFDLLGWSGADYCSFLCGSMESEIHDKYGVQYNQFGLISEYDQAERVSQAIASGEETAEDGFWAPWLVFEIKI